MLAVTETKDKASGGKVDKLNENQDGGEKLKQMRASSLRDASAGERELESRDGRKLVNTFNVEDEQKVTVQILE